MSDLHSPSWYRVAQLRPRLRGHARIHRHHYRGELWYVLEDRQFDLTLPENAESSFIYDSDGNQITLLRTPENRVHKRLDEIPVILRDAVVAIEDERFYLHSGYDLKGLIRSARSNVSAGGVSQGLEGSQFRGS